MTIPLLTAVDLVRQYGGPVSHAALDPSHCTFRTPGVDGLITFSVVSRCAVVLGDPNCAPGNKAHLADAFANYCAGKDWSFLYVAATASFETCARQRGYASIEFANLLMSDSRNDPETGTRSRHLRQHLNHTRRMGVTVREYRGGPDTQLEIQTRAACEAWLGTRHGPQMYLGRPRLFDDKPGRRWFLAEQTGKVVGFLSMLQVGCIECPNLINMVFSSPAAPPHTNELMVASALRALRQEQGGLVCLGVGPLQALGRIEGCSPVAELLWRKFYRLAAMILRLHNKTLFWEKFRVVQREPLYLVFQSPDIGLSEIYALLRAFHFSVKG